MAMRRAPIRAVGVWYSARTAVRHARRQTHHKPPARIPCNTRPGRKGGPHGLRCPALCVRTERRRGDCSYDLTVRPPAVDSAAVGHLCRVHLPAYHTRGSQSPDEGMRAQQKWVVGPSNARWGIICAHRRCRGASASQRHPSCCLSPQGRSRAATC
jgi:hypothetical protein